MKTDNDTLVYQVTYYSNLTTTSDSTYIRAIKTSNFILEKLELPHRLIFKEKKNIPIDEKTDKKRTDYVKSIIAPSGIPNIDKNIHILIIDTLRKKTIGVTDYNNTGLISQSIPYEIDPVVIVHELFHRLTMSLNHTNNDLQTQNGNTIPLDKNCLNLLATDKYTPFGFNLTEEQQKQYSFKSSLPSGYNSKMIYPSDSIMKDLRESFSCCNTGGLESEAMLENFYNTVNPSLELKYPLEEVKTSYRILKDKYNICIVEINSNNIDSISTMIALSALSRSFEGIPLIYPNFQNFERSVLSIKKNLIDIFRIYVLAAGRSNPNLTLFSKEAKYLRTVGGLSISELSTIRIKGSDFYYRKKHRDLLQDEH